MKHNSNEDMNENFYLNYSNCKLDDPSMSLMNSSKKNPFFKKNNTDTSTNVDFNSSIERLEQVVVDFEQCKSVLINHLCIFTIEVKENDIDGEIKISIKNPHGNSITTKSITHRENIWQVEYCPTEIGEYSVLIFYRDNQVRESPFKCNVFDPNKIKIKPCSVGVVGQIVKFEVDASQSGTGQLEIAVDNGKIPCNFSSQGNLKFVPSFSPQESGKYEITVRFNSYEAPGSPFICEIFDVNKIGLVGYDKNIPIVVPVFRTNCVELNASDLSSSSISFKLISPLGTQLPVSRSITPQNTVKLTFQSNEIGTHRLDVEYANVPITGSPFEIKVYDANKITVSEIDGTDVNSPSEFTIDASGAGEGQLEIAINDGLIKNQVKQIKPGLYGVTFVPTKQDTYTIDVKFNNENVQGFPKKVNMKYSASNKSCYIDKNNSNSLMSSYKLTDSTRIELNGRGLYEATINTESEFLIDASSANDLSGYPEIRLTGNKCDIDVKTVKLFHNVYRCFYYPLVEGVYLLSIKWNDKLIGDSPYKVNIHKSCDASKVIVSGDGCKVGIYGQEMKVFIDTRGAGPGELTGHCMGPHKIALCDIFDNKNGTFNLFIRPQEAGMHALQIKYNEEHVFGSPFIVRVTENTDASKVRVIGANGFKSIQDGHHLEIDGDGLLEAQINQESDFIIDGSRAGELKGIPEIKLTGTRCDVDVRMVQLGLNIFRCYYTPQIPGAYLLSIKWNEKLIGDSPYRVNIGMNFDASKVLVSGDGIKSGILGQEIKTFIDTRKAGPGELTAYCIGPQKAANCEFLDNKDGTFALLIKPQESGVHVLQVKYNDEHVPESPFIICISEPKDEGALSVSSETNLIELNGMGLVEAKMNQETDFIIDGSRAGEINGLPEIKLTGNICDIDVKVMQLGHNIYRCSYMPQIPGPYMLSIKMNDKEIGDSPYKINVAVAYDSSKVIVNGDSIKTCVFGDEIRTLIDTRGAGPGELTAHCMGINKVAFCEFQDHKDGTFELLIKPQETGKHVLQIKYNDEHVSGSPFLIGIYGQADASKVKVVGPGINHGVLKKYKSTFVCETKGAGSGQLNVKVRGPKGGFRVEMQRDNQKERSILCKYDPIEAGVYQISVKWAGQHVPGSPFNVSLFNNEEDLEKFLKTKSEIEEV